jgi:hypothetical protein
MTTTGVVGGRWRATVTEWGAVEPWDDSPCVDWFVAADDRWHRPQHETATRQNLIDGTPVVETRVRIPGGDAVQRVYSVADGGGMTVIEVTNDSTLPIAIAFTGGRLLSRRPPTSTPPQGIDLADDAVMFPIGHQATVVVARPHRAGSVMPETIASAEQVARGWLAQTQRAGRLQLPDAALAEAVTTARCELLLNGPGTADDPDGLVLGIAEMVRMGDAASTWVPEIATQLEHIARSAALLNDDVRIAAARVLQAAGERRALSDLRKMKTASTEPLPDSTPGVANRVPSWVERQLAESDETTAQLMPHSFPPSWLGADFEVHDLAIGLESLLSFAVRWHGERPAVLWEQTGPVMQLAHESWTSDQPSGEALWPSVAASAPSFR